MALGQVQQVGSVFFNQTTNILISFIAAKSVVEGNMTLGMMMSLTYIIGQLNAPVSAFIGFARQLQDAKISLEHLNEFYRGKTVVVVAHRLSTVKHADKIVVQDKGKVAEEGTHRELTEGEVDVLLEAMRQIIKSE